MPKKKKPENSNDNEGESFENLQLKKRIAGLEKQLKDAELKAIAFSTMVDIAEKEFNIQLYETSSFVFLFCRFQRQFNNSSIFIHPKYFVFSAFQIVNHGTFYLQ